jgi:hypothetical protein
MKVGKARTSVFALLLAAGSAATVPLLDRVDGAASTANRDFPGWPSHYEGRALTELPLTARESAFARDFPGRVGRFSDGRRELIIRWINAPTRRLHPAADCLRASGYGITPLPARTDAAGSAMSCFTAHRGAESLRVCEVIRDQRGESWPDVSAWYWHAMLRSSPAPWWSFVVAE